MSHAPFIWASYTLGAIVLIWCALAPLARKKRAVRDICKFNQLEEQSRDSNT